jgi:hypothetical protein
MANRLYMVEKYVLRYDQVNERPWIIFTFRIGGKERKFSWFPPADNAVYISDMLRNEKPVFWSPEGKYLTTSRETVGEEER